MNNEVRRIVTTHSPEGKAIVHTDDLVALSDFPGADVRGAVIWTTGAVPADNVDDLEGGKRPAGMTLNGGSVLRITEFGPGFASPMHRSHSVDYFVVLSGELEMDLDGGALVRLHAGDVVVQRGTNHLWRNPSSDTPCRVLASMIEAEPVSIAGDVLAQTL